MPGPLETMPIEDFRRQIEVNLIGQVAVTQAMLPLIRRAAGGSSSSARSAAGSPSRWTAPTTPRSSGSRRSATSSARSCGPGASRSRSSSRARSRPRSGSAASDKPTRSKRVAADEPALRRRARAFRKAIEETAERGIPPEKVAKAIEHALDRPAADPLPGRARRQVPGAGEAADPDSRSSTGSSPADRPLAPLAEPRLASYTGPTD